MKIIVCFKIVPDYEDVIQSEWENIENMDFSFVKKIYNCYDEAALETALRLKDEAAACGETVYCTALTASKGPAALLNGLYAAGFDKVICLEGGAGEFAPDDTAAKLAEYIAGEEADIIFTGRQAGAGDSGYVPALVSAKLNVPWIPEVSSVRYDKAGEAFVVSEKAEEAVYTLACKPPVLVSIGDAEASYLRMFSLKARMEAKKKEVIRIPDSGKAIPEACITLHYEKAVSDCRWITGENIQKKSEKLYAILTGRAVEE